MRPTANIPTLGEPHLGYVLLKCYIADKAKRWALLMYRKVENNKEMFALPL